MAKPQNIDRAEARCPIKTPLRLELDGTRYLLKDADGTSIAWIAPLPGKLKKGRLEAILASSIEMYERLLTIRWFGNKGKPETMLGEATKAIAAVHKKAYDITGDEKLTKVNRLYGVVNGEDE